MDHHYMNEREGVLPPWNIAATVSIFHPISILLFDLRRFTFIRVSIQACATRGLENRKSCVTLLLLPFVLCDWQPDRNRHRGAAVRG
jgi:hypothetical protein